MLDLSTVGMERFTELVKRAILLNELSGNKDKAYKFSDPDGKESGKSGYSFSTVQFDIENNWDGILCLKACGFRPKDLDRLFEQRGPIEDLNAKLYQNRAIVDRFALEHIDGSCEHVLSLLRGSRIQVEDMETLVHIVDYHNQLYMSPHGALHRWLLQAKAVNAASFLAFKFTIKWGRNRPDDVQRRFRNIKKVFAED
jgi:hypothetical protein